MKQSDKLTIVIVDSGVDIGHPKLCGEHVKGFAYENGNISTNFADTYGHGTAVYHIIREVSDIADIINIKIPNIEFLVEETELSGVLNYISENVRCDILNLSLGINICNDLSALKDACDKLAEDNVIIISAFDNTGSITYPAAFNNVIGVMTGRSNSKITDFEYIDDDIVNITAKGNLQRVAWSSGYTMAAGNSFACAHATVQAAKFMDNGARTRKEILRKFKEVSHKQYRTNLAKDHKRKIFTIQKAAIFPFNKEMHSLVRYCSLLPFDISEVYDTKYSLTVGATTTQLLRDRNAGEFTIKNISQISWDKFDTLILGHLGELSSLINKEELGRSIIEKALQKGKQIYSFDDLSSSAYGSHPMICYPRIDEGDLPPNRFGMLYRISKPVVGVFGTSSRQGKFTLQLKLREIMLRQGYNVGQIGTEPSSLLYGMDYVFPMGYHSSVYIKEFNTVQYINHIINDLCMKGKDIIIVGSQSGTIPYDTGNLAQYTIPQINFLLGTQPDCVVLCVNPFDSVEYIKRTVCFIESSVDCTVAALVVFPMNTREDWAEVYGYKEKLEDEKYFQIESILSEELCIPVFQLGIEKDMYELVEIVTDFFVES